MNHENRRADLLKRIMKRTVISDTLFYNGTPCMLWTGPTSGSTGRGKDYPRMSLDGATVGVHIVMYTNVYGYIPYNKTIDHECKNRLCINPCHLSMVSLYENHRRRDGKKPHARTPHRFGVPADVAVALGLTQYLCEAA